MDASIISIITTTVLAVAAIFVFLVERARYLREIEPDIELKWPENIQVSQMSQSLKEFWAIYINVEVKNISKNHAEDLDYQVELGIFPQRGKASYINTQFPNRVRTHPAAILAGRSVAVPVYIGWNLIPGLYERLQAETSPLNVTNAGFKASITFSYFSRRELILWLLVPWKLGRVKYKRTILGWWGFESNKDEAPYYFSKSWQFPKELLEPA